MSQKLCNITVERNHMVSRSSFCQLSIGLQNIKVIAILCGPYPRQYMYTILQMSSVLQRLKLDLKMRTSQL